MRAPPRSRSCETATLVAEVRACGRNGDWARAEELLYEAQEASLRLDVACFSALGSTLRAQWPRALHQLEVCTLVGLRPDQVSLNAAVSVANDWYRSLDLIRSFEILQLQKDIVGFGAAVTGSAKTRAWSAGLNLCQALAGLGLETSQTAGNARVAAATAGDWSLAGEALRSNRIRQLELDIVAFGTVLGGLRWRGAIALGDKARQTVGENVVLLGALLDGFAGEGLWEAALTRFAAARRTSIRCNTTALNAALSAAEKGGRWRLASWLLAAVAAAGLASDVISVNSVVSSCRTTRRWPQAFSLLLQASDHSIEPTTVSRNALLSAYESAGEWQRGLCLAGESQQDTTAANALLSACEKTSRWSTALLLAPEAPDDAGYGTLVTAMALAEKWQWGLSLLGSMGSRDLRPFSYSYQSILASASEALGKKLAIAGRQRSFHGPNAPCETMSACRGYPADTQDCGSKVDGRSAVVSSVGEPSRQRANDSVVSSSAASFGTLKTYQPRDSMKDLKVFADSFAGHLRIVMSHLLQTDEDLSTAVVVTHSRLVDLVGSAQTVLWKLSSTACSTFEKLPSLLWASRCGGKENELDDSISEIHSSMAVLRKETQAIRNDYIELLKQVQYVGHCTQVTMDQAVISSLPEPDEDEHGILECPPASPEFNEAQRKSQKSLQLTLAHLEGICQMMEDCSDFWLMLHHAELQLRKLEKEASVIRDGKPCTKTEPEHESNSCMKKFCEHLKSFCGVHCGVPPTNSFKVAEISTR
ncbi:unnamed protein product [Symbiodinium sp. CCMP2456]|nr:unnamed protein product [Symbiodinium sp. CCMP2456]